MDADIDRVMTSYFAAALIEAGGPESSTPAAERLRQRQALWRERGVMEPATAAWALLWANRRAATAEVAQYLEASHDRAVLEEWMAERKINGFRYVGRTLPSRGSVTAGRGRMRTITS
ncbi:hypothetical protein [Streptacidiphilus melanogenes]|uniref:hypothetical protein n=1 Tax=Streptacidiphilus melanogenes TaxID=411235 RepID=UPI0005AA5F99|nr:hypothetical protein [Streptacidiphilus melanogenes]